MEYEFDSSHERYIEARASGRITKADIIVAASELMKHPDFLSKQTLWIFFDFSLGIDIDGLKEVTEVFRLYRPKQADFVNKQAIVVPSHMYEAVVNLSITIANGLPFEFHSFTDKDTAVDFLCSE